MKKFLNECRECWIATVFVLALFVAQAIQWKLQIHDHDFALPMVLRLLDFTRF